MDGPSIDALAERALARIDVERLIGSARLLIDTPSPTGSERACARRLAEHLVEHGVAAEVDAFGEDRANVTARVGRADGGLALMLNGHLDTTGYGDERDAAWLVEHGPGDLPASSLVEGIVVGLGAYNMKGGVAAAAEALIALAEVGGELPGSVTLAAVASESEKAPVAGAAGRYEGAYVEGGGLGSRRVIAAGPRPDAVIVCEPSGLAVVNAQPGYRLLRILVTGRAGYLPAVGVPSVIDAAAAVVLGIRAWTAGYAEWAALDCGLGILRPTCTVGAIEAGWPFKPGGPPAGAALFVDLRIPPQLDPGAVTADVTAAATAAATAAGPFGVVVSTFADHTPGAVIPAEHPLVAAARTAVDRALPDEGPVPEPLEGDFPPGDDGKLFAAAGIPYVKVGPGTFAGRDPRFGREQVRVDQLVGAARAYVLLALDLATRPSSEAGGWPRVLTRRDEFEPDGAA